MVVRKNVLGTKQMLKEGQENGGRCDNEKSLSTPALVQGLRLCEDLNLWKGSQVARS